MKHAILIAVLLFSAQCLACGDDMVKPPEPPKIKVITV